MKALAIVGWLMTLLGAADEQRQPMLIQASAQTCPVAPETDQGDEPVDHTDTKEIA